MCFAPALCTGAVGDKSTKSHTEEEIQSYAHASSLEACVKPEHSPNAVCCLPTPTSPPDPVHSYMARSKSGSVEGRMVLLVVEKGPLSAVGWDGNSRL